MYYSIFYYEKTENNIRGSSNAILSAKVLGNRQ
nr:MAG TPA: hypothetical protein [Caudoviricetes sp.]